MIATLKYREPRGIDADTEFYGFYSRVSGDLRKLLKKVRAIIAYRLGAEPSNALMRS